MAPSFAVSGELADGKSVPVVLDFSCRRHERDTANRHQVRPYRVLSLRKTKTARRSRWVIGPRRYGKPVHVVRWRWIRWTSARNGEGMGSCLVLDFKLGIDGVVVLLIAGCTASRSG